MLYTEVRKFFSDIILDPYTLKDLRLLVSMARQDFINSVMNLRTLELAKRDKKSEEVEAIIRKATGKKKGKCYLLRVFSFWRESRLYEKTLLLIHADIREKRAILNDIERALEIAENNNYEEMERRDFFLKALEDAEYKDDAHYESRLENIEINIERMSEKELLVDIRKQLAEVFFSLEKMNRQAQRRHKWQLDGPPSEVRDKFKKFFTK